jgi:tripartite-type tricarboxylate transporter receptor subunit TctC
MRNTIFGTMGLAAAVCCAVVPSAAPARADDYPSRPITLVVPYAAGGPTDVLARHLGQAMGNPLHQRIVVENVNGAGGTIGTARVARARPDGYTLLLMHIGIATAPALYRALPYDTMTDLEPIGRVADVPMTIVAAKAMPDTLGGFLAYAQAHPTTLNYADAGVGSSSHLCGLLFMQRIGMTFTTISYKGNAPAMNDLIAGHVDLTCDQVTNTAPQIKSGAIKLYGVTSRTRLPQLPEAPTLDEQALAGFDLVVWFGLWSSRGTPKPIIDSVGRALQAALVDPTFRTRLDDLGATPTTPAQATPEALRAWLQSEIRDWGAVLKGAGVMPE